MFYRLPALLVAIFFQFKIIAQCTAPVPEPPGTCNSGTDILLTDGASINSGQVYYFTGGPTTFTNVSLNGGLLRVCGNLTVTNLAFNGGKMIITNTGSLNFTHSGVTLTSTDQDITNYGSLTINSGFNVNAGSEVINAGTITLTTATTADGPASLVYNSPGGVIMMAGLNANVGNQFINYGTAVFGNLTVQGAGSICMGEGAIIETNNLTNNTISSVSVLSGTACISYTGSSTMNQQLTSTSNLTVCKKAGAEDPTGAGFGSATVIDNCSSCLQALPVTLSSFSGKVVDELLTLTWVSEMEDNLSKYIVEKSLSATTFNPIAELNARNRPGTYTYTTSLRERSYYRLKLLDIDGHFGYSKIILASPETTGRHFSLLNNPCTDGSAHVSVYSDRTGKGEFILYDGVGRALKKLTLTVSNGNNFLNIPLDGLKPALYILEYRSESFQSSPVRLIKIN